MEAFRFIDHTGDLGLEVFGDSLTALFQHAGDALTEIITDAATVRRRESKRISLEADGIEALLVRWLNELVFLFDTDGLLGAVFDVTDIDDRHLAATVWGEVYDETRHPIKTTVKSATYHQLEVVREKELWRARVIFDL
jgi:SHS2 domain-containing protein